MIRGNDATGFAAVTDPVLRSSRRRLITDKLAIPADLFPMVSKKWRSLPRVSLLVAHTRLATSGSSDHNRNNHPHFSKDKRFAIVHNGIIPDHEEAAQRLGLLLSSDCDSEVLLRLVEAYGDPVVGLRACLQHSLGSMAIALLDVKRQRIYLARSDDRPLWLCRLRHLDGWLFASTGELIVQAIRTMLGGSYRDHIDVLIPLASGCITSLSPHGRLMTNLDIASSSQKEVRRTDLMLR